MEQILPIFREILELPDLIFEINQRLDVIQRQFDDFRGVDGATVDLSGIDHGALAGLDGDDHSQYLKSSEFDATTFMYALTNNTPQPKTPAEVMAILSGEAAATFDFNSQNLTGIADLTAQNFILNEAAAYPYLEFQRAGSKRWLMRIGVNYAFYFDNKDGVNRFIFGNTGDLNVVSHNASTIGLKLGGTLVTASAAELNYLDGISVDVQSLLGCANEAAIRTLLDLEVGVDFYSISTIDTALALKAPLASPTFTGAVTIPETAGVADYDKFLVVDNGVIKYRTGAEVLSDIGSGGVTDHGALTGLDDNDHGAIYYTETEIDTWRASTTQTEMGRLHGISVNGGSLIGAADYAAMLALLSGEAAATFDFNSQNLTGIGTIGCGVITPTGVTLATGCDIVVASGVSSSGLLSWTTANYSHHLGASYATDTLCFWPSTADQGLFYMGHNAESGAMQRFLNINMYSQAFEFQAWAGAAGQAVLNLDHTGYINLSLSGVQEFTLSNAKTYDFATAAQAWDDAYADDWHNVADFYCLDTYEDLQTLLNIKPSGIIDERTGLPLIDDNSLPKWTLSKYKKDKDGYKKGDVMYDIDNKPYLSLKMIFSLLMGAIKELDKKKKDK